MMWAYANGMIPFVDWASEPGLFRAVDGRDFVVARNSLLFHPPADPLEAGFTGPPTTCTTRTSTSGRGRGLSMHPIEHLIYFTSVLIFWVVPSHPIHAMFALQLAALAPAPGHSGFDEMVVKGKATVPGDFLHYLHHRYFECNYASSTVPFDRMFGTFHDGSAEAHARMKERWREKHA